MSKKESAATRLDQLTLFDSPEVLRRLEPELRRLKNPIWTENKAQLIERYLYYFVLITKHGAYIDGFAGPQQPDRLDSWAANLVLASEPRWFRHFHLIDADPDQIKLLKKLKAAQPTISSRQIWIHPGDCNIVIPNLLGSGLLKDEATFCLLDQRTFECHWATLEALAAHRQSRHKIELFYFFPIRWLNRALAAVKDTEAMRAWWGRDDWISLKEQKPHVRAASVCGRFREELGYNSAKAWPIFEREGGGGSIMYYMIHATDHPEAPKLMSRAYARAVEPKESPEQLALELPGLSGLI